MRYTVVDRSGGVSFVAHCNALHALLAACADGASSLERFWPTVSRYDHRLGDYITSGLAVFDEHNAGGNYSAIHAALVHCPPHQLPVFRVVDEPTRQASLQSVKAGVILFNLLSRRIVQIINTYAEIQEMFPKVRKLRQAGWRIVP